MGVDGITPPLRLAKGSHQPGSGKGCAMNVVSYTNGDERVTDFPVCSARPLAVLVQSSNDLLAGPGGYLPPENSLIALELGWQTVGTAEVSEAVVHAWVAELLTNPAWGVVRYAKLTAIKAIIDIAELHRKAAIRDTPSSCAWNAVDRAARATVRELNPTLNRAGLNAIQAAYESTALVRHRPRTLDAVTGSAARAHALAAGSGAATRVVEVTRHAIRAWRHLAELAGAPSPSSLDNASSADSDIGATVPDLSKTAFTGFSGRDLVYG